MTLPGVNSLVSVFDDVTADSSKDPLLHFPPPNTSSIVPQAKIDPKSLLNVIHVDTDINTQHIQNNSSSSKSVILPKINTSPFLVTNTQSLGQNKLSYRKNTSSTRSDKNSIAKQNSIKSKYLRDRDTAGMLIYTE